MIRIRHKLLGAAIAAMGLLASAGASQAGFTTVNPPSYAGELSPEQIIKSVYGESASFTRVDDDTDQIWSGQVTGVKALAKFAGYSQTLSADKGSGPETLFNVSGNGLGATGSAGGFSADSFSLVRSGTGNSYSSVESANSDAKDHMVSYLINTGENGVKTYALFFEDMSGSKADFDFNDLAVELKTAAVPLPAAVSMGVVGLGLVALAKRFRRQHA